MGKLNKPAAMRKAETQGHVEEMAIQEGFTAKTG